MDTTVHPVARSESESESIKSVIRSSRSCGYLTITATTITFSVILIEYAHYTNDHRLDSDEISYIHFGKSSEISRSGQDIGERKFFCFQFVMLPKRPSLIYIHILLCYATFISLDVSSNINHTPWNLNILYHIKQSRWSVFLYLNSDFKLILEYAH